MIDHPDRDAGHRPATEDAHRSPTSGLSPSANRGDLARRIGERRRALGLSIEEVSTRSGIDAAYLAGLERRPWASITSAALTNLARALETTLALLGGGETQVPPGRHDPDEAVPIWDLAEEECRQLIVDGGVGRVVFDTLRGPVAIPVNFRMATGDVVFRTKSDAGVVKVDRGVVSFEVDNLDDALAEGWSVLITGRCAIESPTTPLRDVVQPWAGGDRQTVVRLHPAVITGRRIRRVSV